MKKVLVVDDTKNIRILLTKCLELEGYEVLTATDGMEAIELLKKETFDLAFLDIKMPKISGTEVLKRIREFGVQTPVIIITAYATIKNAVECTQLGAVAYLQKPFSADKVRSVLNEIWDTACAYPIHNLQDIEQAIRGGAFHKAIDMLREAIAAQPENPMVYSLFSKAFSGAGDAEKAEKFSKIYEAIKKNPE